jgi:hypothetical protein
MTPCPRCLRVVAIAVACVCLAAPGWAEDRPIDVQRSTVTVRVFKSGLFRAFADDHIIQAQVMEGSIDEAIPHMQMVFDARNLRVLDPGLSAKDRQAVQARMLGPEVLDVARFQWISFHSITIQRLDAGGWMVNGELELHGKIRPVPVKVVRDKDGRYKGSVRIKQSEFGIAPISIIGGTVKVKDEIVIDFDIVP